MTPTADAASISKTAHLAGKYLTFVLGQESYGIPVLKVREIITLVAITPVPQMPSYVQGVINLRGKVIPVLDLRLKFSLPNTELTDNSCIVVVQIAGASGAPARQIGLIVDAVEEVANITAAEIEEAPDFGSIVDTSYMLGMAKSKAGVKTLLNIDQVIAADELSHLSLQNP